MSTRGPGKSRNGRDSASEPDGRSGLARDSGAATAIVAAVVALALVLAGGGVLWWRHSSEQAKVERERRAQADAVDGLAQAWSTGHLGGVGWSGTAGQDVTTAYDALVGSLRSDPVTVHATGSRVDGARLVATYAVSWSLTKTQHWDYTTTATFDRAGERWAPRWSPALVHPKLTAGDALAVRRTTPTRGEILGRDGTPIVTDRPVVDIGVEPGRAKDLHALAGTLGQLLDVDAAALEQRARAAKPDAFVPVITLRREDYLPLRDRLRALDGIALRDDTQALAPSREFARALLGTVGPVTAEIVKASQGRYVAGDDAGRSGLQAQYDEQLAGSPGLVVQLVHPGDAGPAATRTTLWEQKASPGTPLRVTLDPKVQQAADDALAPVTENSALVAVDATTGDVLAVANGPEGGGYDRALLGRYAPGSTFKVATTLALLEKGFDPATPVACPEYATVQGKTFHNYAHEHFGPVPFHVDFAKSCNTAFISLAPRLGADDLTRAAASLGVGADWSLGTKAFSGSVPPTEGPVDAAAASFGQGRLAVSPLAMAVMAASVAEGRTVTPRLVLDGAGSASSASPSAMASPASSASPSTTASPASSAPSAAPLPADAVATLRSLMREVVTSGTATNLQGLPGGPVSAKTGTAEFGDANPPETHVWLVGYQDGIAFAAFVEKGDSGSGTAGPIVQRFLRALH